MVLCRDGFHVAGHFLEDLGDDVIGGDAFGFGFEVEDETMAQGRFNVSFEDIQSAALPALRHRLIPNFEAEAEGITTDHVIAQILQDVPVTAEAVNA